MTALTTLPVTPQQVFTHGYDERTQRVFVRTTVKPRPHPYRWQPKLLPLSRLHRKTLVEFESYGLRTGDTPVRAWFHKPIRLHPDADNFFRGRRGEVLESLMTGASHEEAGTWDENKHLYDPRDIFEGSVERFQAARFIAMCYGEWFLVPRLSFKYVRPIRKRKSRAKPHPVMLDGVSVEAVVTEIRKHRWSDDVNRAVYDLLVLNCTRTHPLAAQAARRTSSMPIGWARSARAVQIRAHPMKRARACRSATDSLALART